MHIEDEPLEIVTFGEQEYDEVIEEYEEILVQEDVPEPPVTDFADTAPAQGKPRCITPYFWIITIYICYVHLRYRNFMKPTCIDIPVLRVLLVHVRVAAMLRFR